MPFGVARHNIYSRRATSPALSSAQWSTTTKLASIILSNGNLTALAAAAAFYSPGACDVFITSGQKVYFEVHLDTLTTAGSTSVGVANASNSYGSGQYLGLSNNSIGYFDDGTVIRNNATVVTYGVPVGGDIIGVAMWGGNSLWFAKNGTWQSGDPNTLTGGITTASTLGDVNPAYNVSGTPGQSQITANFGGATFYAPPTGFITLP